MNEILKYSIEWYKNEVKEAINFHSMHIYNDQQLLWALSNLAKLMQELKKK